jgi:hypothetical protein
MRTNIEEKEEIWEEVKVAADRVGVVARARCDFATSPARTHTHIHTYSSVRGVRDK